ncbi:helix-turn-helix domain-containing protein [Tropicimonas sp. TH_r6]|uniref:helix-turn-helix domain-containing protein n=1 Tax=Tropicimonas sp. TH_r6 TaxID=3082085 RepID=UPI002954F477|nr:helix-turn-helix domain-containing protein [Tropicimonas sp. TH_r6]MDV7145676.1 helix-turn-helix domain-containing protein [Tropicimonas sp. TH_r6]
MGGSSIQIIQASFQDIDVLCESVRAWDVEFYPLSRDRSVRTVGTLVQGVGRDAIFSYSSYAPGLSMFGSTPEGQVTFNVMEPSQRRYWVRGHDVDSDMVWVFPVGAELRSVSSPGFEVYTLSAPPEKLERVAEALELPVPPGSKRPETFPVRPKDLEKLRMLLRLLRDGHAPFPVNPFEEALRLLVPAWLGSFASDKKRRPTMRARDIAVRKVLELQDEPDLVRFSLDDMLKVANVSERTLQYAFRERFGVTPGAFIKAKRLTLVRSALRRADPDDSSVGEVAARFGFWHVGQFAADYRNAFDEVPSKTLGRSNSYTV